ncbi:MAG TPA: hypothetical protein VK203_11060 [Nostocaceae cyanobacterium]|nr:hypothetical protein [Nostocaceae cyanobacterium]
MVSKKLDKVDKGNENLQEYREQVRQATLEILTQSSYKEILAKYGIDPGSFIVRSSTITSPEVKSDVVAKINQVKLSATEEQGFSATENVAKAIQEILNQSNYSKILKKHGIAEENYIIRSLVVTSPEVKTSLVNKTLPTPSFIASAETDSSSFAGCTFCYVDDFGNTICVPCPCPC